MRRVFVDTLYWIAITNKGDAWHGAAIEAKRRLRHVQTVTTDSVLIEFLGAVGKTRLLRQIGAELVREILGDNDALIVPQDRDLFLEGLNLYEARRDKGYSLVDCISMNVMRSMNISDILTNDSHFGQEGFNVLIHQS